MSNVGRRGWVVLPALLHGCIFFDVLSTQPPPDPTADTGPLPMVDTGSDDEPRCFQEEAVELGLVRFEPVPARIDPASFAARPELPLPSGDLPGSLVETDYYGAIAPDGPPWWSGWTVASPLLDGGFPNGDSHPLQAEIVSGEIAPASPSGCAGLGFEDGGRAFVFGVSFPVCVIRGTILTDLELTPDHLWVLDDEVYVGNGDLRLEQNPVPASVTLTVRPGTQILARSDANTGLVITRGSEGRFRGTAERPIVMSAVALDFTVPDVVLGDPTNLAGRGQWMGLALSGLGLVNVGEASVTSTRGGRWFGGPVDADRSGDLDYVVIAEAGLASSGVDRAALNLEGAGRGTTIDHVQIFGSEDDCIQMLGGAAFVRHLACHGPARVGIDQDLGYTGEMQWALVRLGQTNGRIGLRGSNNAQLFDAPPASAPRIANLTVLGGPGSPLTTSLGALHYRGWRGQVHRSVYADGDGQRFESGCLDIDDALTSSLRYFDTVFDCSPQPLA
ncbi:MAG: hypothetical protein AAF602_10445, partial [Myxococcota bacterium]